MNCAYLYLNDAGERRHVLDVHGNNLNFGLDASAQAAAQHLTPASWRGTEIHSTLNALVEESAEQQEDVAMHH